MFRASGCFQICVEQPAARFPLRLLGSSEQVSILVWVAVRELRLSYHNMRIYLSRGVPDYSNLNRSLTATKYSGGGTTLGGCCAPCGSLLQGRAPRGIPETWRLLIEGHDRTSDMNPEASINPVKPRPNHELEALGGINCSRLAYSPSRKCNPSSQAHVEGEAPDPAQF